MPVRTLAEATQRLRQAEREPRAGDDGIDVRGVVRLQNAIDAQVASALDEMQRAVDQDRMTPEKLGEAQRVSFALLNGDPRTNNVALREAQTRLTSTPGITEAEVGVHQGEGFARFKLLPQHPVYQRISQLLAQKSAPKDEATRVARFVDDVVASMPLPTPEEIALAQHQLLTNLLSGLPPPPLTRQWEFAGELSGYFGRGADLDGDVVRDAFEATKEAFQRIGIEAKLSSRGEGVVRVRTSQPVPGEERLRRFEPVAESVRPEQAVIDAAVAEVENALEAALERLTESAAHNAFVARFSDATKSRSVTVRVLCNEWAPNLLSLPVLVEAVRQALAAKGYDQVALRLQHGFSFRALQFIVTLPD